MRIPGVLLAFLLVTGCAGAPVRPVAPAADRPLADAGSEPSRAELRARLAARRQLQIERLAAYREAGVFPRQRLEPGSLVNVMIDDDGHLCAIASLMEQAGEGELVRLTAAHSNTIFLADVKDGPLLDWILGSGLTQAEVAFVQEPYVYDPGSPAARERERRRLMTHFLRAEERLVADTEQSLDDAVDRLIARRAYQARLVARR